MFCFRHGEVEHVSTVNNTIQGAIHFLSCGCFGTAEQLRDEGYDPNPPATPDPRIAELEAKIAELEARMVAGANDTDVAPTVPATVEPPAPVAEAQAEPEAGADVVTPPADAPASPPTAPEAA